MGRLVLAVLALAIVAGTVQSSATSRHKRQTTVSCEQADIIFVLDSSGSIGSSNWPKLLAFVKDTVQLLDIGRDRTRIGVVSFGNRATLEFNLNTYDTRGDVLDAIDQILWKDQETNTSGAIWFMRESMFTTENGDRSGAPNIGIVITDGESNRGRANTIPFARDAQRAGITMFSLGIGDSVNETELVGIASNESFVFRVDDFNSFGVIKNQIVSAACDIPVDCTRNADIAFILDASGSVRMENFIKTKDFVKEMVDTVNVGPLGSSVAVITFSDSAQVRFNLGRYDNRQDIKAAIDEIPYTRGTTNTAEALRVLRNEVFQQGRPDLRNIAVLMTDGGSNDFSRTIIEAKEAREAGIVLISIGIKDWVNMVELREIASDPDRENVFNIENFDVINRIKSNLKAILCEQTNECESNPCQNGGRCVSGVNKYSCRCPGEYAGVNCEFRCGPVDVALAVDSSGSIGPQNYYTMLDFAKMLVESMNIHQDYTRIAMETFSSDVSVKFHLKDYSTKEDVVNVISFPYVQGTTNTALAIRTLRTTIFQQPQGDRPGVRNVAVVITDGRSDDKSETFKEAVAARESGIDLLAVAINLQGNIYGQRELRGIATDPDDRNVMNVDNFESLFGLTEGLVRAICNTENECAANNNPCGNYGTCIDGINGYECRCFDGRTGPHCEKDCDGRLDLVFVVDSSGSIRQNRFEQVLKYICDVIKNLEVADDKVRVGMITYSDTASVKFHLNAYKLKQDVIQAVESTEFSRGRTNTADALRKLRTEMYTAANGDRFNVPNIAIVLTDGQSNINPERTIPEAIDDKISGIHMMAVTVMPDGPNLEIKGIATDPDTYNMFNVARFNELGSIISSLVDGLCNDDNECSSNPCANGGRCINALGQHICACPDDYTGANCQRRCMARADVVFMLDASGSIERKFEMAMDLTRAVVQGLNFAGSRTRVGILTYSDSSSVRFDLDQYTDKQSIMAAIAFKQALGRTNTAGAIDEMRRMFSGSRGDRVGDPNYGILITDGYSNVNQHRTLGAANDARRDGITMMAVGIGENGSVDRAEINGVSNDPDNLHAYVMRNTGDMDMVVDGILDVICQE